jgi:SAM-dependent methyltransferase
MIRNQLATGVRDLLAMLNRIRPASARPGMSPPVVTWPTKPGIKSVSMRCPNCASHGPKSHLLTIEFTTSPGSRKRTRVMRCPNCGCPFYADQIPPDYAEEAMLGRGRVPFYLQQGAGLSLITRPLAQVRAPAGSVYAEIGCGFGFGLDYARHAKHWTGRGIDPGGISALGQEMLGVTIESRYLGDSEPALTGTCDVVMASETIEHVLSPSRFVAVLRSMLRPGGIVILTTPDAADLRPDTAPGVLIGLLSPGLHLIFQTRESLHRVLAEAGFRHIVIDKDGHSLVAFASDQPVALERDTAVLKAEFRAYLEQRSADFSYQDDLFLAFAGRAFQEAMNDSAFDQARRVRTEIERACVARFGLSLDDLGERTSGFNGLALEDLAQRMPLSLGGLLYADAILRLACGTERAELGSSFLRAAAAADLVRIALADLAMADGMSEEIAWTARAEAVLCLAAAGASDVLAQLAALPAAPDAENGQARREVIAERTLVALVNAGHYALAADLSHASGFDSQGWADADQAIPRTDSQRDALFCLAVLDSKSEDPAIIERSRGRFKRIKQMLETQEGQGGPEGLLAAANRGEVAANEASEEIAWSARAERVMSSAAAGAEDIVAQLLALPAAPDAEHGQARRNVIAERTLVALVNGGHYGLARDLSDACGFASSAWADPDQAVPRSDSQRDALFCLAVVDSQSDEPALIERSRRGFNRIKQLLSAQEGHGGPEGLFDAADRGETAAVERLGHLEAAADPSDPEDG